MLKFFLDSSFFMRLSKRFLVHQNDSFIPLCSMISNDAYLCTYSIEFINERFLASHTTHVVCVNFMREWRNNKYLRIFFMACLNQLRGNHRRNIFFLFRFDVLSGIRTRALRLISLHTTYWTTQQFLLLFF